MAKHQKSLKGLIPGLLLVAGVLVMVGAATLSATTDSHGNIQALLTAAIATGAVLLLIGAFLIALPWSKANGKVRVSPPAKGRFFAGSAAHSNSEFVKDKQEELLKTIQTIERNLDQVVGQVRERLNDMAPVADDRNPSMRNVADVEISPSEDQGKKSIH